MISLSFLHSVIRDNDVEILFKVKDDFLDAKEQKHIDFVQDYFAKYNKLPDISTVETKFSVTIPTNSESTQYWYDEIVSNYQEWVIEQAVINSAKNKSKAIDLFQQAIIDHNVDIDGKVYDYSDGARRIKGYDERKKTGGITHISTGLTELDTFSLGYKRADLWTIGGREGIGKSWKLLRMADALDQWLIQNNIKKSILIVSGEMDAIELEERLDAIRCEISYALLSKGALSRGQERLYKRYLNGFNSNIRIVDSFDNLRDVEYYMTLYKPTATFIDGSHLLSSSYEWTEIAKVTSTMKKLTRNKKIPIINTTHLKAERGKSADGGDLDDFAYTKGYTRDSDIVGVMFASDMMEVEHRVGIDFVKVRRGTRVQIIWENDYENCTEKVYESKTGSQLVQAGSGGGNTPQPKSQKTGLPY